LLATGKRIKVSAWLKFEQLHGCLERFRGRDVESVVIITGSSDRSRVEDKRRESVVFIEFSNTREESKRLVSWARGSDPFTKIKTPGNDIGRQSMNCKPYIEKSKGVKTVLE
jgi:hypothetical protein